MRAAAMGTPKDRRRATLRLSSLGGYLRSSVRLIFNIRGLVINVGASQTLFVSAYAAFAVRIVLLFSALNRSRLTVARMPRYRTTLPKRRSSSLSRSRYTDAGSTMLSDVLWVAVVVPESKRPRLELVARYAFVAVKFAARPEAIAFPPPEMPGRLRNVAAICTSIFGTVYDSNALKVVSHGSVS